MNNVCPVEQHDKYKADDAAWDRLEFVGVQKRWDEAGNVTELFELRNCFCGSSLLRPLRHAHVTASPQPGIEGM